MGVLGLADTDAGKVSLIVSVADDLISGRNLKAGMLVKELAKLVGGGGGGRPTLAMAGGRQPEKLDEALAETANLLQKSLDFLYVIGLVKISLYIQVVLTPAIKQDPYTRTP